MNAECEHCEDLGTWSCTDECEHWDERQRSVDTTPASCCAGDHNRRNADKLAAFIVQDGPFEKQIADRIFTELQIAQKRGEVLARLLNAGGQIPTAPGGNLHRVVGASGSPNPG
jgi:hypothetical protein